MHRLVHGSSPAAGRIAGCYHTSMTSLLWLTVVVLVVAVAAITGLKPKGTKPVARTQLMGVARVVLVLLALILAYFAFASRS